MLPSGGPVAPVVLSTNPVQGGPAIPVYGYTAATIGTNGIDGGPALPVKVVTDAELIKNGGKYWVEGDIVPMAVYKVTDGRATVGGPAIPVYVVGGTI